MAEEYITKIELLKICEISYGQLYRWKREELIPEQWFIKRSSYTGQETVFPKDLIIERIDLIQKLKSTMSHDEISQVLLGKSNDSLLENFSSLEEVDEQVINLFDQKNISYHSATIIIALSDIKQSHNLDIAYMKESITNWNKVKIPNDSMFLDAILLEDRLYINFRAENCEVYYDEYKEVIRVNLNDIKQNLKLKGKL